MTDLVPLFPNQTVPPLQIVFGFVLGAVYAIERREETSALHGARLKRGAASWRT